MTEVSSNMKVRHRADPGVVGWVISISGRDANVFVGESVKIVPIAELEPVCVSLQVPVKEFKWGLTHKRLDNPVTDQYLSYKASNTRLFYHQFLPVKKMLESPGQRLLVADEVGTGKTIEAGLIWAELESRSGHGLENVWVICPKSLVRKWRDEMLQRFDFHLEELSSDGLRQALVSLRRDGVLSPRFSKCVVNLELLRIEDYLSQLQDSSIEWDLAIFDEAHHLRNTDTLSYALSSFVCERSKAAVFLTATPLQTDLWDLVHLMEALGVDVAEDPLTLEECMRWDMRLNDWVRLVKRHPPGWEREAERLLSELDAKGGRARPGWVEFRKLVEESKFANRASRMRLVEAARNIQVLSPYMTRTLRADVQEERPVREAVTEIVGFSPAEEAFYAAVYQVCLRRAAESDAPPGFVTQMPERRTASCVPAVASEILYFARPDFSSDESEDEEYQARFTPTEVDELRPLAQAAVESQDAKLEALIEMLDHAFGELGTDRAMIFSTFRGTLRYLADELRKRGYSLEIMYGPTPARDEDCKRGEKSRERIAAEFRRGEFQVLLASEVAGEGLDFEHCCVLINYDLPWNPMRVEQRIGRCDRLGQASDKVHIRSLASDGTIEARILKRLYERLGIFERALGELEFVLGDAVAKFERDLFRQGLSEEQQNQRLEQTAQAIENQERHRASVAGSSVISTTARQLIDSDQQEISDAEAGFLSPGDLADFVHGVLELHLPNILRPTRNPAQFRMANSDGLQDALQDLLRSYPAASNSRTQVTLFRSRLRENSNLKVSFTGEDPDADFIHARHPLVLLARNLEGKSAAEMPWCAGVVPPEMASGEMAVVWAIGTLEGYAGRSELLCASVDVNTGQVASLPIEQAQRLARAMEAPSDEDSYLLADVESLREQAEQTLLLQFKEASESFVSRDRILADKAKQAVKSLANRRKQRNDDQLAKPDLDDRLRTLHLGWNRRIEQETAVKLDDIERKSGVRSSFEVIGMMLLFPQPLSR